MIKLTKEQIEEKEVLLSNLELECKLAKVKFTHFKSRMNTDFIEKERQVSLKQMRDNLKLLRQGNPKKEARNALEGLEQAIKMASHNIKALRIQLKDGEQPHYG